MFSASKKCNPGWNRYLDCDPDLCTHTCPYRTDHQNSCTFSKCDCNDLLNLEKIARSSRENIRPTVTTTATPIAAHAVAQKNNVSASCPPMACSWVMELMASTLYAGSYSSAADITLQQCNVHFSDCSHLAIGMHCSAARM